MFTRTERVTTDHMISKMDIVNLDFNSQYLLKTKVSSIKEKTKEKREEQLNSTKVSILDTTLQKLN